MLAAGAVFLSCCQCVSATGDGLVQPSISEWVDIWRIDGLLTQRTIPQSAYVEVRHPVIRELDKENHERKFGS